MKKKLVYLHIGLHKTGSKWIQKIFSLNAPLLEEQGIVYPIPAGDKAASQAIHTFDTNAQQLFSATTAIQTIIREEVANQPQSLLLSAEVMSKHLAKRRMEAPEQFEQELQYLRQLGFEEIHFLLLIRDPVEHAVSKVNHNIKAGKLESMPDEEYYKQLALESSYHHVLNLIEFIHSYPNCKVTLLNYEAVKQNMVTPLSQWLDLADGILKAPEVSRINRSLTYSELYALTSIKGPARYLIPGISHQWMTTLPGVQIEKLYPSVSIQEMIWNENMPHLDRLNSLLPQQEQMNKKIYPAFTPPETLTFLPKQLEILLDFLAYYQSDASLTVAGSVPKKTFYRG